MSELKRRGRPKQFDREHTLAIATRLYWAEGLEGMSINQICESADVSKPSLYREFGNEDGLLTAVFHYYTETVTKPFLQLFDVDVPFEKLIPQLVHAIHTKHDNSEIPTGCLAIKMRNCAPKLSPELLSRIDAFTLELQQAFETWFTFNQTKLPSTITPNFAAKYLDGQLSATMALVCKGVSIDDACQVLVTGLSVLNLPGTKVATTPTN